jgi:hypothetical protein
MNGEGGAVLFDRQSPPHVHERLNQVGRSFGRGAHAGNRIAHVDDGGASQEQRILQRPDRITTSPGQQSANLLETKHLCMEDLKQRIMELARDANPLAYALLDPDLLLKRTPPESDGT